MTDALPMSRKQIASIVESANTRITIWSGAVRSGKTVASIVAFFHAVATAPDSGLILICGRTLQTIERNILEPMQDETKFGPLAYEVHHTRGSSTAIILGRTIHLIGASDVRAEGKLRGLTACLALVDEATLLPENFWSQLLARLSVPGARCLATTNPDNPQHYLKVNFIDRADVPEMNLQAWNFTLDDNPHLRPEYVTALKAENQGLFYLRNILGQWVAADGAVYDCFDPERHVVPWDELPDMQWYLGVGVDHGTTNPTAATMLGLGVDNVLYAVDEWRHESSSKEARWTNVQLSEGLRTWLAGPHHPRDDPGNPARITCPVYVDPAAADYRVQLKQDGLATGPAQNDVLYGIRTVSALFSVGRLKISDRCPGLLKEIPGYVWDTKATEEGKDAPIKLNDHSCFIAGTLIETESGPVPIESVQVGARVWTRSGLREVVDAGCTGISPVHTVEMSDGTVLTGTANHPIWVEDHGFTRIDELRYRDRVVICESVSKQSFSKASDSAATPTQNISPTGLTSPPGSAINSVVSSVSMRRSGWIRTASPKFRRGITSTTSTTTRPTMIRRTWRASLSNSIGVSMPKIFGTTRSAWNGSENTSTTFAHSQRLGMRAWRGASGIASMLKRSGRTGSPGRLRASTAAVNMTPPFLASSAPTTASRLLAENLASTSSTRHAKHAAMPSVSTSTAAPVLAHASVVSVSDSVGPREVYNLTVADAHEYFANGVLVHNCDSLRYAIISSERKWRRRVKLAAIAGNDVAEAA